MLKYDNADYFREKNIIQIYYSKNPHIFFKKYNLVYYNNDKIHTLFIISRKKDLFVLNKHKSIYSMFISDKRIIKYIPSDALNNATYLFTNKKKLNDKFELFDEKNKLTNWCKFINKYNLLDVKFNKCSNVTIDKRFNINFKQYTNENINLDFRGAINNEIVIMENLSKSHNIYYDGVLINSAIKNGILDINVANELINKLTNNQNKFDVTFYRGSNNQKSFDQFEKIPGIKVFSHNYIPQIWDKNFVGFQTYSSYHLSQHNKLGELGCDGSLFYKNDMIIPKKTFIRYQFLDKNNYGKCQIDIKKLFNADFVICVTGSITRNNFPKNLIDVIVELRNKYCLNIILLVMGEVKNINDELYLLAFKWIILKNYDKKQYMQTLKKCDLLVNTWHTKCTIYSGSNKNLDGIVSNIPIVVPFSLSYSEILGKEYNFYYDSFDDDIGKNELKQYIEIILNGCYNKNKLKKKFKYIKNSHNDKIEKMYYAQIKKIL